MKTSPRYLPTGHPVRYLLDQAAYGSPITAADLQLLGNADLPPSEALTVFADEIEEAGLLIAQIGATGARQEAQELAQEQWEQLAATMTDHQRAVDTTEKRPEPETDIDAVIARVFTR